MKNIANILVMGILLAASTLSAQPLLEHRRLVDAPTAALLDRGSYSIEMRMFANGGLLSSVNIGITHRFMIGMSYGGENVIGEGDVNLNPEPGILARVRVVDETMRMPAFTIGFESQGFGPYNSQFERYETKSRGLYVVGSKNYAVMYNLGLHGGVNWSLEHGDKDKEIDVFVGAEVSFNREFHAFIEYDFANNDNEVDLRFGSGRGYLNGGIQWIFADQLYLQFNAKNMFENGPNRVRREFKIGYFEYF